MGALRRYLVAGGVERLLVARARLPALVLQLQRMPDVFQRLVRALRQRVCNKTTLLRTLAPNTLRFTLMFTL